MTDHHINIEAGSYWAAVVCTAGPGAPCRMVCTNPDCEETCSCVDPVLTDIGECNWSSWLNEDDTWASGEGGCARLPITVSWNGDGYRWAFAGIDSAGRP